MDLPVLGQSIQGHGQKCQEYISLKFRLRCQMLAVGASTSAID